MLFESLLEADHSGSHASQNEENVEGMPGLIPIEMDEDDIDSYNEMNEEDDIILPNYGEGPGDRVSEWVSEVRPKTHRIMDHMEWSDEMFRQ